MLTVDFRRMGIRPGDRVLDVGCGAGRHAFEAHRRGADVVAFDANHGELGQVTRMCAAMRAEGQAPPGAAAGAVAGDATAMPFDDGSFDKVIAAEVLEHIPDDQRAISEIARVLKPGGIVAVTVPSWLPERICWALSDEYHEVPGGHVRIYTRVELEAKLRRAGFAVTGRHHAHGLHSPYWWVKCMVGVGNDDHPLARAYHRMLVWDIVRRPAATRLAEQVLNPLIGKSVVIYAAKQAPGGPGSDARLPASEHGPGEPVRAVREGCPACQPGDREPLQPAGAAGSRGDGENHAAPGGAPEHKSQQGARPPAGTTHGLAGNTGIRVQSAPARPEAAGQPREGRPGKSHAAA